MRLFCSAALAVAALLAASPAIAQTEITIGKIVGGIGLHLPSYIAMDQGYYKADGRTPRLVDRASPPMTRAGMSGNLNFVPIPSGGAQAVLKGGAKLKYVVNQSLSSQYVFVARPEIKTPEDLRGKTIGFARPGAADYDEGATVLARYFKMQLGKDYKVLSLPGDPERVAALLNKDIDAAMVSTAQAIRAVQGGMRIVLRTGDHLQRVGGCFWVAEDWYDKK